MTAIGDRLSVRKTLTSAEQAFYTGISGNLSPLYVDAARARAAGLDGMLSFELILGALATTCINRLGGPAKRVASLSMRFPAPVPVGASVEVAAEIVGLDPALRLRLTGTMDGAGAVLEGEAELADV